MIILICSKLWAQKLGLRDLSGFIFFSKTGKNILITFSFFFLPVIKLYSLWNVKSTVLFSEVQRILNEATRVGTKTLAETLLQRGHRSSATALPHRGSRICSAILSNPTPLPLWGEFLNLINEFRGYLLKSAQFENRTDPEELAGRRVVWFIVIDYFQQKSFWSCKAKQGHKLGDKMNLMPGFIWYKIFIYTGLGPFLAILINIHLSDLNAF